MKITNFILIFVLCMAPSAFAQKGRNGKHNQITPRNVSQGHGVGRNYGRNINRGRGAHNQRERNHPRFNREGHRHLDRRNIRVIDGRRQIFFEGVWFSCGYYYEWPSWVFTDDIYIVEIGPGIYEMYSYTDPELEFDIFIVR